MSELSVSVVIVNWNTRDYLRNCLRSLAASRPPPEEIIVVDNASTDGSADMVRNEFPALTLLANETNRMYAAGNNQGIATTRGELIWLLNPDTEVATDSLKVLRAVLVTRPELAAVACRLIDPDTRQVQPSVRTFPTPAALWCEALGLSRLFPRHRVLGQYRMGGWNLDDEREIDQPMTSCLLVRRAAAEPLGWFDERFPLYFNDVDFCYRLKEAGWRLGFTPATEVIHHVGASTRQVRVPAVRESHRALSLFYSLHYAGRLTAPVYYPTVGLIRITGLLRLLALRLRHEK